MRKYISVLIIIIGIVIISVFLFFFPIEDILTNLPILSTLSKNTTLEIITPKGKASIKINGKEYGETPASIKDLKVGTYQVELTKIPLQEGFYKKQLFNIKLTQNTTSVINMEIGTGDNLHGVIIHYEKDNIKESGKGKITITSNTQDTKVYINNEFLKNAPITNIKLKNKEYNIKLKTEDYEDLEFPVIVSEGYILHIKGYQLPIPISFENE
jgi:hypothetical protein